MSGITLKSGSKIQIEATGNSLNENFHVIEMILREVEDRLDFFDDVGLSDADTSAVDDLRHFMNVIQAQLDEIENLAENPTARMAWYWNQPGAGGVPFAERATVKGDENAQD